MIACPYCRTSPSSDPERSLHIRACRCRSMYYIPDEGVSPDAAWRILLSHADGLGTLTLLRDGRTSLGLTSTVHNEVVLLFSETSPAVPADDLVEMALDIVLSHSVLQT